MDCAGKTHWHSGYQVITTLGWMEVRLLAHKAPHIFRALLLHELAHIKNRDVGRAYFTEALWRSVILVIVIPFGVITGGLAIFSCVLTLLSGKVEDWIWLVIGNVLGLPTLLLIFGVPLVVLATIRASLLRIREYYADWRAALWGSEAPLTSVLKANADQEESPWNIVITLSSYG